MSMPIMPVAKNGACPSGYHAEGNMCVPSANAKPVIAKDGPCPSGWHAEGHYCVANASNTKNVIPKKRPLPVWIPCRRQLLCSELVPMFKAGLDAVRQ